MPTNTDLVTDLPADFEVFGQAVATSMADLLGGTSGQILSKATNANMDFIWINNDQGDITGITATSPLTGGGTSGAITVGIQASSTTQSGAVQLSDSTSTTSSVLAATPTAVKSAYDLAAAAIPKSTVTTNGDVIYATGSGAVTRLGIGSTGQVLTVAAGIPSWATPAGAGGGPAFQAYSTPQQSVSSSTNTKATMTNEKFDTAGNFASSRFTPTTSGYYQLRGAISYTAGADKTSRAMIYFNGSPYVGSNSASLGPSIANPTIQVINLIYFNGSTDYAELYGWSDSASPEFYQSSFEGVWIRS